jgi:Spy/CpxP family protein refolding chaperone
MRKLQLVLAAAMLVGGSVVATAQDPQPQGQRQGAGRGIGMLMQGITLTAEQQTKVDTLNAKYATERRTIMQDESLDQDTRRAKSRELMGKQREELKALLTDEQKKVFDKNVEEMQARMQGGGGRPPRS